MEESLRKQVGNRSWGLGHERRHRLGRACARTNAHAVHAWRRVCASRWATIHGAWAMNVDIDWVVHARAQVLIDCPMTSCRSWGTANSNELHCQGLRQTQKRRHGVPNMSTWPLIKRYPHGQFHQIAGMTQCVIHPAFARRLPWHGSEANMRYKQQTNGSQRNSSACSCMPPTRSTR